MTNLTTNSRSFNQTVRKIQKWMPGISKFTIVFVYVVSGFVEGWFLSGEFGNGIIGGIMGFLVGYATQITRAVIVFFDQLNADRVKFSYASEIIALVFGAFAIASIVGLVLNNGLSISVAFSLSFLMVCGVFLEIKFLKEIRYANRNRLLKEGRIPEIAQHAQAMKKLEMQLSMIDAIDEEPTDHDVSAFRQNLLVPSPTSGVSGYLLQQMDEFEAEHVKSLLKYEFPVDHINGFMEKMVRNKNEKKENEKEKKKAERPLVLDGVLNGSMPQ